MISGYMDKAKQLEMMNQSPEVRAFVSTTSTPGTRVKICGNLRTFKVSLETSFELAMFAATDTILVSESGLSAADDLRGLRALGYRGFLIGETLMRARDTQAALRELRREVEETI